MEAEARRFSQKQRMFTSMFAVLNTLSCDLRKYMHQFLVSLKTIIIFFHFLAQTVYI